MSYLHGVEANSAKAVYAPGERADWAAPLLIPDVHLLATCCKHSLLLVVIQSCEDCLQETKIFFYYKTSDISLILEGSKVMVYYGGTTTVFDCNSTAGAH